jgi:hypothetical protein
MGKFPLMQGKLFICENSEYCGLITHSCSEPMDKISQLFAEAKALECPNRLSGAARRKFANLCAKNFTEWSVEDKKFMEFAEYTRKAREKYFIEHKNKTEDGESVKKAVEPVSIPMETEKITESLAPEVSSA